YFKYSRIIMVSSKKSLKLLFKCKRFQKDIKKIILEDLCTLENFTQGWFHFTNLKQIIRKKIYLTVPDRISKRLFNGNRNLNVIEGFYLDPCLVHILKSTKSLKKLKFQAKGDQISWKELNKL